MRDVVSSAGGTFPVHAPDISDWAEITSVRHPTHGETYVATADGRMIGELRFLVDFPEPGIITVGGLWTDPDYRGRGVGTCLIAALHADHPGEKISPGAPPEEGLPFLAHLLEVEPTVRAEVALVHPSVAHLRPTRE